MPVLTSVVSDSQFNFLIYYLYIVAKGVSANLLKDSSKRRRTLKQIKADKDAAAQREADIEAKLAMVDEL